MNRRTFVAALTATGIGSTAILINSRSTKAASVAIDGLEIPDQSHHGEVNSLEIEVDAIADFESTVNPDSYTFTLSIGDAESTMQAIDDVTSSSSLSSTDTVEGTLTGSLTETYHFAPEDFEPNNGGERSTTVWVGLDFELVHDGESIESASVTEPVQITVNGGSIEATLSVGGTGTIEID